MIAQRAHPIAAVVMLGVALALAGCGTPAPGPVPAAKSAPAARTRQTYQLVGIVRRVTPAAGEVHIQHEAIPGFMDAMTMPFSLEDRRLLDDLKPGDAVEGTLQVDKEGDVVKDYALLNLAVTRPAEPPPRRLVFSATTGAVSDAPKRLEPGQPVPDFTMTTQDGTTLKLSDLRGKVVVLTFIYTRCPLPDFCPLMDRKFAELAGKLAALPGRAEKVRLLSVSFDPEHDTPDVLRKHAQVQGARPPLWTFAVAAHDELAKVAAPLGLMYGPTRDEIIHNLSTAVIDEEGRLARLEVGTSARGWSASDLMKQVAALVASGTAPAPAPAPN